MPIKVTPQVNHAVIASIEKPCSTAARRELPLGTSKERL